MSDVHDVNRVVQKRQCSCCQAVKVGDYFMTESGTVICYLCYYFMTGELI